MDERDLTDGEAVYRSGDPQDSIFLVLHGYVVMAIQGAGDETHGQVLGPGSVFSAADALGDWGAEPGIAAHGDVTVRIYSKGEARSAAAAGQDEIGDLLATALRIGAANVLALGARMGGTPERANSNRAVKLMVPMPDIAERIGRSELDIDAFPFVIGRQDPGDPAADLNLSIRDQRPYQLSRRHFMIDELNGVLEVRDCGSHNGTIVNDVKLGRKTPNFRATLRPGQNTIIAGSRSSRFRFLCVVDERGPC